MLLVFIPTKPADKPAPPSAETLRTISTVTSTEAMRLATTDASKIRMRTAISDQRDALESLRAVGLETLHDDNGSILSTTIAHGPNGRGGLLLDLLPNDRQPAYQADAQEWFECAPHGELPGGRAWIGWSKAQRPTPETLARKKQIRSKVVALAHDQLWFVPVARQLDSLIGGADRNEMAKIVSPLYPAFFDSAWSALVELINTKGAGGDLTLEAFTAATLALSLNYRMSLDLASALGILTNDGVNVVRSAACEFSALGDMMERKTARYATFDRWRQRLAPRYEPTALDLWILQNAA